MTNGFGQPPQQAQPYQPMQQPGGEPPAKGKLSGLAIASLVLSLIMCVPICPFIGAILGIVAVLKIGKNPSLRGKGMAIAGIVLGIVGLALSVGVSFGVAVPAFTKYVQGAKAAEAEDRLSEMFRSAVSYYSSEQVVRGDPTAIQPQFPASAPLTPPTGCCGSADGRCQPNPGLWDTPTWQALNFAIMDPHYYQYEFVSDGNSFTARAIGDLDCDGVYSTYERSGVATPDGMVQGSRGIYRVNPYE